MAVIQLFCSLKRVRSRHRLPVTRFDRLLPDPISLTLIAGYNPPHRQLAPVQLVAIREWYKFECVRVHCIFFFEAVVSAGEVLYCTYTCSIVVSYNVRIFMNGTLSKRYSLLGFSYVLSFGLTVYVF